MRAKHRKTPLPEAHGDFYAFGEQLRPEEREIKLQVRDFMRHEIAPIVNDCWLRGEFPMPIIPGLAALDIAGLTFKGYGFPARSCVLEGLIAEKMAGVDVSISTFFGVQSGLAMGSIYLCGSEEQKKAYLPKMRSFELLGAFGLTEPDVGSGVVGGLTTTCRRDGDTWVLNGKKKWIGNATFSDFTIIWSRDAADNEVKGFLVDRATPGFEAKKVEDKMALRIVQNAEITMTDCRVPETKRLQNGNSFKDTARVLRMTRAGVAWQAVGCARGAYEHTIRYVQQRHQFGRPIGSFQMVQDLVAHMLSQLTAMQAMVFRLSQMQDEGKLLDEHASLAKVFCTSGCREVVSRARELHGGNGILLSHDVARFVADSEALYSYEGTKQINSLIVGRSVTGSQRVRLTRSIALRSTQRRSCGRNLPLVRRDAVQRDRADMIGFRVVRRTAVSWLRDGRVAGGIARSGARGIDGECAVQGANASVEFDARAAVRGIHSDAAAVLVLRRATVRGLRHDGSARRRARGREGQRSGPEGEHRRAREAATGGLRLRARAERVGELFAAERAGRFGHASVAGAGRAGAKVGDGHCGDSSAVGREAGSRALGSSSTMIWKMP